MSSRIRALFTATDSHRKTRKNTDSHGSCPATGRSTRRPKGRRRRLREIRRCKPPLELPPEGGSHDGLYFQVLLWLPPSGGRSSGAACICGSRVACPALRAGVGRPVPDELRNWDRERRLAEIRVPPFRLCLGFSVCVFLCFSVAMIFSRTTRSSSHTCSLSVSGALENCGGAHPSTHAHTH
jgi:hypothetical protein